MKPYKMYIGIDISKSKLDVCFLLPDTEKKPAEHFIIANTHKGIAGMITRAAKTGIAVQDMFFCFEHTGVYGMPLCYCLQEYKAAYQAVPAIEIKRSKGLVRGKSDKTDARDIALYALTHNHKMMLSSLPEKT